MRVGASGQTAMLELLFGSMLVLVLLIAVLNSFENAFSAVQYQGGLAEAREKSAYTLERLLNNAGKNQLGESDWENNELEEIREVGLALGPNVVSQAKLVALARIVEDTAGYTQVKEWLGLGNLEFSITVLAREDGAVRAVRASNENVIFSEIGKSLEEIRRERKSFFSLAAERSVILDQGRFINSRGEEMDLKYEPVVIRWRVFAFE